MATTHPVMWFEVLGADGAKLKRFYGDLFAWAMDSDNPMGYGMVEAQGGKGIPGGVGPAYAGTRPWVTFYVETPDIDATLAKAVGLGGSVVVPRTQLPDTTLAIFADPEGHAIGLVEAKR